MLSRILFTLLALLQWLWHGWLSPAPHIALMLLAAIPISCFLPWVWMGRRRVLLAGVLFSILYFIHGAMEMLANPDDRWLAGTEVLLCVLLYISVSLKRRSA